MRATPLPPGDLAPRGATIEPFYAGLIGEQAAALARAGRVVVPMHYGQPTQGAPATAVAAAERALARAGQSVPLGYYESPDLKARIARHYRETYGVEVTPARILLTMGASAALVATFAALFAPGDRIALARPGYPAYRNALAALGREIVEVDCGPEAGFRLTPAALARLPATPHGLVCASPANPTGAVLHRDELAALLAYCRERGIRFVSDEIYHGITYAGRATCALELDDEAIVVNSFSKYFRMPGWRLGWLVVPERFAAGLSNYLINFFLTPPAISQHAALGAFDDPAALEAALPAYARNRGLLLDALPRLGFRDVVAPEGAFYFYVGVGHWTDDSLEFCRRMLDATGVSAAPGIDFDPVHGGRTIRFSFAVTTPEVERAIEALAAWLPRA
ncbi:MAG: aminotransferase class I/II-fold pyridoxal phosphate-dependent enzyme [Steroidobacteraceae bacterium]|nr:aminotransferase class I/II-fold pyridoxal phosphate-dependent enzyme [Steroidobacteraceae bacterium]